MTLADRVMLLNGGKIEQEGTPAELYNHPRSAFAARFIGSTNLVPLGALSENSGTYESDIGSLKLPNVSGSPKFISLRPERVVLQTARGAASPANSLDAVVQSVKRLGGTVNYTIRSERGALLKAETLNTAAMPELAVGQSVRATWQPEDMVAITEDA